MKKTLTTIYTLLSMMSFAQNAKNEKFGIIKIEDFSPKLETTNEDALAIVLSDIGSSEFVGNNSGSFTVVFKQHKKILIKKKAAFEAASFSVNLYQGNSETEEILEKVEAATYNLEQGKIVVTKLNKDNVIKEKYNRFYDTKKFTMPDVKEGCIIEYSYVLKSQFDKHIHPWDFQNKYPTLWSEFQVTIPPIYNYVVVKKGNFNEHLVTDTIKNIFKAYSILTPGSEAFSSSSIYTFSGDSKNILWAMKNVPAIKNEDFVLNPKENIIGINFQLLSIKYSELNTWQRIKSWNATIEDLYESQKFGLVLNKEELGWLSKESETVAGNLEGIDAAKKIYNFVKNRFTCTNYDALLMSETPKKIFETKKGNVADINLILTSMLARKGFEAEPIFLSTSGNGKPSQITALLEQFDYVICKLKIDSNIYYLDAADTKVGFGKLGAKCYNGYGRLISKIPYLINLSTNDLKETKTTVVFVANGESSKMEASISNQLGYYESQHLRESLGNTGKADYFKTVAKSYLYETKIEGEEIEKYTQTEEPLTVKYDMKFAFADEDIIYFNPLLTEAKKENIFKASNRTLPIEMPYTISEVYTLDMEIPTGYIVDEMPKSVRSKYNDNQGLFEYIIAKKEGHIQLRCKFQLDKANFTIEDYDSLREFYGLMVKKHAEQIVFKKIKK